VAAHVKPFRLVGTKEARTICPYCAVSCGMMVFQRRPNRTTASWKSPTSRDADNPVNRGTLCPKGAGRDRLHRSKTRVQYPMYRKPGTNSFERVSWDFALERIAKLTKDDRDANFIEKNKDGVTVNRWTTMTFLAVSSLTNEGGRLTYKVARGLGLLQIERAW